MPHVHSTTPRDVLPNLMSVMNSKQRPAAASSVRGSKAGGVNTFALLQNRQDRSWVESGQCKSY